MIIIAVIALLITILSVFIYCGLSGGFENFAMTCYSFEAQELLKKLFPNAIKKQIPDALDYLRLSKINGYEKELTLIPNKLCNRGNIESRHEELFTSFKKYAPDYNCARPIFYVKNLFNSLDKRALYSQDFKTAYLPEFVNLCKEQGVPESGKYTGKIITETISDVFHMQSIEELLDFVLDFGFNSHVYFFAEKQNYCKKILVSLTDKVEPLYNDTENEQEIKKLGWLLSKIPIQPLGKSKSFYHMAELHIMESDSGKFIERINFNPDLSDKNIECELRRFVLPVFKV